MRKVLLIATALLGSAHTFSSVAAQPSSSVLQSLPAKVQKDIEETRTSCRSSSAAGRPSWSMTSSSAVAATRDTTAATVVLAT